MAVDISALLRDVADEPVGRQLRWYLSMLLTAGEGASLADFAHYVPRPELRLESIKTDEEVRNNWRAMAGRMGTIEKIELEKVTGTEAILRLHCAKERRWRIALSVESA